MPSPALPCTNHEVSMPSDGQRRVKDTRLSKASTPATLAGSHRTARTHQYVDLCFHMDLLHPGARGAGGASHSPTCSPAPSSGGVPPPNWGLDAYRPISWQLFLYVCPSLIGGVVSALGIHLGADSRTPPNPIQRCFLCGHHSSVDWLFHLACHWSRMTSDIARNVIHDLP